MARPSERNAHPHVSEHIVVVHNGIIENHEELREELKALGCVQLRHRHRSDRPPGAPRAEIRPSLLAAMQVAVKQLRGAYGTVVMDSRDDSRVVVARSGSPLVIGPRHRRELHRLRPDGPAAGDPPLHLPGRG